MRPSNLYLERGTIRSAMFYPPVLKAKVFAKTVDSSTIVPKRAELVPRVIGVAVRDPSTISRRRP
jgi:hypothetical protein